MYYVYVDRTSEGIPYYVGKGDFGRTYQSMGRNQYHAVYVKSLGQIREVVLCTRSEIYAIRQEQKWIQKMGTYRYGPIVNSVVGANLSLGGEGRAQLSDYAKDRLAIQSGRKIRRRGGWHLTQEQKQKLTQGLANRTEKRRRCRQCGQFGHRPVTCTTGVPTCL
jgi:hypothetical protein